MTKWIKASERLPGMKDELSVDRDSSFVCRIKTAKGYVLSIEDFTSVTPEHEWAEHCLADAIEPELTSEDLDKLDEEQVVNLAKLYAEKIKTFNEQSNRPRVTYITNMLLAQTPEFYGLVLKELEDNGQPTNG